MSNNAAKARRVANKYRFGGGGYVNNEANIQEIINVMSKGGPPWWRASNITHWNGNQRKGVAQRHARMFAYMPQFGYNPSANTRRNINAYFNSIGMNNATKLKTFKATYSIYRNPNYPIKSNENRWTMSGGYAPTIRNMNWFNHANKEKWVAKVKENAAAMRANAARHRQVANTPVNVPWPAELQDPISYRNKNNWPNSGRAIEVRRVANNKSFNNKNILKNYINVTAFNSWYGSGWKNMPPTSKLPIHPSRPHPMTSVPLKRNQIRLVQFTGNK
jgi:hypothetical protein